MGNPDPKLKKKRKLCSGGNGNEIRPACLDTYVKTGCPFTESQSFLYRRHVLGRSPTTPVLDLAISML